MTGYWYIGFNLIIEIVYIKDECWRYEIFAQQINIVRYLGNIFGCWSLKPE